MVSVDTNLFVYAQNTRHFGAFGFDRVWNPVASAP